MAFRTTSRWRRCRNRPLVARGRIILNGPVLIFTVLVSVVTAALFGVLPLLYVTRIHSFGARGSVRTRGSRMVHDGLVVAQVTLTIVLLAAAVSVGSAFVRLMRIDRGYDVKGIATAGVSLDGTTHQGDGRELAYFEEVLDRIRNLPGVHSASAAQCLLPYGKAFNEKDRSAWMGIRRGDTSREWSRCSRTIFGLWADESCLGANSTTRKYALAPRLRSSTNDLPGRLDRRPML